MFMLSPFRAGKLYALRVLRAHDMDDVSLHTIYRSSSSPRWHNYASSACRWGFVSASDLHRLEAFIRRSDRRGFVPVNLPTFADLCENADDKLFNAITSDCNHVLHYLPPVSRISTLRPTATSTQHRTPLSNWPSHWQELHSTHAVLELILAVWLCIRVFSCSLF